MRRILSNLGLVLQIAGIFMVFPIIMGFVYEEYMAIIYLFVTSFVFLALGFLLNSLCVRREMNTKQSSSLFFLVFLILGFVGAIPYIFLGFQEYSLFERITNSVFESISGFTTTGFSFLSNIESLPKSIIFYRALTQFIGGIGIVLVLLAFFYPERKLNGLSKTLGIDQNRRIKQTVTLIIITYLGFGTLIFSSLFFGSKIDVVNSISLAFAAVSTGGFSPIGDFGSLMTNQYFMLSLVIGMVLGASNFILFLKLMKFKIGEFFKSELGIFLLAIVLLPLIFKFVSGLTLKDSLFNMVSAMTNTGFQYTDLSSLMDKSKIFLFCAMFVGGTTLSTAGGIKVLRVLILWKAAKSSIKLISEETDTPVTVFGRFFSNEEVIQCLVVILSFIITIFLASFLISSPENSLSNSLFEVTSAITNTGLSVGVTNVSMLAWTKWLFMLVMLLGRVEIIAFFVMIAKKKNK